MVSASLLAFTSMFGSGTDKIPSLIDEDTLLSPIGLSGDILLTVSELTELMESLVCTLAFENVEWKELRRVLVVLSGSRGSEGRVGVRGRYEGGDMLLATIGGVGVVERIGVAGRVGTGTLL